MGTQPQPETWQDKKKRSLLQKGDILKRLRAKSEDQTTKSAIDWMRNTIRVAVRRLEAGSLDKNRAAVLVSVVITFIEAIKLQIEGAELTRLGTTRAGA